MGRTAEGHVQEIGTAIRPRELGRPPLTLLAGASAPTSRITVDGKHLRHGDEPFSLRGVTYGSFSPRADGALYPHTERVESDFAAIAASGLNVVRLYTAPPPDLLDLAEENGLRLFVGLQYEDWRYEAAPGRRAQRRVRDAGRRALEAAMEACAGRTSVLAVCVGNEVPPDVTRVHGIGDVEDVLSELVEQVHEFDPEMLATYANYPSTEYLRIAGQDLASFNVFLEDRERLRSYVARLQVVAADRPLVLTEVGLAGGVHGAEAQADALAWQLLTVDEVGAAGAIVFSWTDEWAVGGRPVDGWNFGLTEKNRRHKPALYVVREWAGSSVSDLRSSWPRVSVIVCAYNAQETIGECLTSLEELDYPNFEVIVCDDGSSDGTADVAQSYPFRLLRLDHDGLSAARNAGVEAATGEIVAFLDSDACCHPSWLYRIALALDEDVDAVGGPNLPVLEAGFVERVVAASPGGPVEVLLSDERAEHVPGCNMAFRRDALLEIGGFDPVYRTAGDDVDVCWKLLERGREIGFAPTAQVRHHRRSTIGGYLRQQRSYGRAERILADRWSYRMNRLGMARWAGSLYGGPRILPSILRPVVYHGHMGFAPFQGVVRERHQSALAWASALLPLTVPVAALGVLAPLSDWWLAAPALAVMTLAAFATAVAFAVRPDHLEPHPVAFRALVGLLHITQPLARMSGRLRAPATRSARVSESAWTGNRASWLTSLHQELLHRRCHVRPGTPHADYDLSASVGVLVACRVTTAVVWGWTPLHRVRYRVRPAFWPALGLAAALMQATRLWGVVAYLLLSVALLVEFALLRRLVRSALASTTRCAHRSEPGPERRVQLGSSNSEPATLR
jgi:GT2 family glycosyltransferase